MKFEFSSFRIVTYAKCRVLSWTNSADKLHGKEKGKKKIKTASNDCLTHPSTNNGSDKTK